MTDNGGDAVGQKALKGYVYNIYASVTNEKTILEQLFASNAKISATNEELVAVVKKLTNDNKDIQQESSRLKKRGVSGATHGNRYLEI